MIALRFGLRSSMDHNFGVQTLRRGPLFQVISDERHVRHLSVRRETTELSKNLSEFLACGQGRVVGCVCAGLLVGSLARHDAALASYPLPGSAAFQAV